MPNILNIYGSTTSLGKSKSKTMGRTLIRIKDKRFDSLAFKDVSCHSAMATNVSFAFTCVGAF